MKKVIIPLLALSSIIIMLAGCSSSPSSSNPPAPETHDVSMVNMAFQPASLTINEGDTVKWTNNDVRTHTSTSGTSGTPDGKWDSGDVTPGNTYERVFDTAGSYPYYCTYHYLMGMTATIEVVTP